MIQNPHYIIPFSAIDLEKRGEITEKNMQTFLMYNET